MSARIAEIRQENRGGDVSYRDIAWLCDRVEALERALRWHDYIEDVEASGHHDSPLTVNITRTNGGWRAARADYDRALA